MFFRCGIDESRVEDELRHAAVVDDAPHRYFPRRFPHDSLLPHSVLALQFNSAAAAESHLNINVDS